MPLYRWLCHVLYRTRDPSPSSDLTKPRIKNTIKYKPKCRQRAHSPWLDPVLYRPRCSQPYWRPEGCAAWFEFGPGAALDFREGLKPQFKVKLDLPNPPGSPGFGPR